MGEPECSVKTLEPLAVAWNRDVVNGCDSGASSTEQLGNKSNSAAGGQVETSLGKDDRMLLKAPTSEPRWRGVTVKSRLERWR